MSPATRKAEVLRPCDHPQQDQESQGAPLSEGDPLRVPLLWLRAWQATRTHQAILPVWQWLPELMKVMWYVLFQSHTGDVVQAVK